MVCPLPGQLRQKVGTLMPTRNTSTCPAWTGLPWGSCRASENFGLALQKSPVLWFSGYRKVGVSVVPWTLSPQSPAQCV